MEAHIPFHALNFYIMKFSEIEKKENETKINVTKQMKIESIEWLNIISEKKNANKDETIDLMELMKMQIQIRRLGFIQPIARNLCCVY